jgi:anaerobic dimethyl sulfoxide reductase subunit A
MPQVVWMHPIDAGERGINDGDMVYIYNDNGCIKLKVELTKRTHPKTIVIGQGAWYRASSSETYDAWYDTNGDGVAEKHTIPVDVGGNVNSLIKGRPTGASDPLVPSGHILSTVGNLCEVSKVHPDKM